jgi:RNase P subunit RPR2
MVCQRCQGLLVSETFCDLNIETNSLSTATRCINCGYIEDAVVRANRLCPPVRMRKIPRRMDRNGAGMFNEMHT